MVARRSWSIIVPVFKKGDPTLPNNYRPISLVSCFFKVLEHYWVSPKADSVGVPMSSLVLPLTHLSLSSTFRKHLTHHGSKGLWCGFLMLVSGAACGASCAISWMARDHKFVVARHFQNPGWTLALLKAESSLHFFSTSSVRRVARGVQFCSSSLRVPGDGASRLASGQPNLQ